MGASKRCHSHALGSVIQLFLWIFVFWIHTYSGFSSLPTRTCPSPRCIGIVSGTVLKCQRSACPSTKSVRGNRICKLSNDWHVHAQEQVKLPGLRGRPDSNPMGINMLSSGVRKKKKNHYNNWYPKRYRIWGSGNATKRKVPCMFLGPGGFSDREGILPNWLPSIPTNSVYGFSGGHLFCLGR